MANGALPGRALSIATHGWLPIGSAIAAVSSDTSIDRKFIVAFRSGSIHWRNRRRGGHGRAFLCAR